MATPPSAHGGPSGVADTHTAQSPKSQSKLPVAIAVGVAAIAAVAAFAQATSSKSTRVAGIPSTAQVIDQTAFNVMPYVPPPSVSNGTFPFILPGYTMESMKEKPFHIYDDAFLDILGPNPQLTLIAKTDSDPLFHEAFVWAKETDEMFFAQNAGAKAAGTGLKKPSIVQKISLAEAASVEAAGEAGKFVAVITANSSSPVLNPNGGTNFRGEIVFAAEGQGDLPSSLTVLHPKPPYNTTVVLNNFFGRQFSSLNDVAVHPINGDVYFTDTLYGYLQDFRPAPGARNQVYRWNPKTGAVTVVADGFTLPNGFTFTNDGKYAYVTDTGCHKGFNPKVRLDPASIYRFDVLPDGTFANRKTFAYIDAGVPDGIHCDVNGNVFSGVGDGVAVWNPSGTLIGKIFLGTTCANFQWASGGRMVIGAETQLYYATIAALGTIVESEL